MELIELKIDNQEERDFWKKDLRKRMGRHRKGILENKQNEKRLLKKFQLESTRDYSINLFFYFWNNLFRLQFVTFDRWIELDIIKLTYSTYLHQTFKINQQEMIDREWNKKPLTTQQADFRS